MRNKVGTPLYDHVATVVNLVLDDEIDGNHVRKIVNTSSAQTGTKSSSN
jgi:hypothetical protein